jgi:hypothetical protein
VSPNRPGSPCASFRSHRSIFVTRVVRIQVAAPSPYPGAQEWAWTDCRSPSATRFHQLQRGPQRQPLQMSRPAVVVLNVLQDDSTVRQHHEPPTGAVRDYVRLTRFGIARTQSQLPRGPPRPGPCRCTRLVRAKDCVPNPRLKNPPGRVPITGNEQAASCGQFPGFSALDTSWVAGDAEHPSAAAVSRHRIVRRVRCAIQRLARARDSESANPTRSDSCLVSRRAIVPVPSGKGQPVEGLHLSGRHRPWQEIRRRPKSTLDSSRPSRWIPIARWLRVRRLFRSPRPGRS